MFNEQAFMQQCYDSLSEIYDVNMDDYEEMKPDICRIIDDLYARFTPNDYKELVHACYTQEQLMEHETLSHEIYVKLAMDKQSMFCGKILWGFIDICRSECDTLPPLNENEDELNMDDWN